MYTGLASVDETSETVFDQDSGTLSVANRDFHKGLVEGRQSQRQLRPDKYVLGRQISFSFVPYEVRDLETNENFMVTSPEFLHPKRYRRVSSGGILVPGDQAEGGVTLSNANAFADDHVQVDDVKEYHEVERLGYFWRIVLKSLVKLCADETNALRLTRGCQLWLPFLTGYETYVLGQVIAAFGSLKSKELEHTLRVAFRNRNVSRVLVIQLVRYDFLWHQDTQFKWNRWFDSFGSTTVGFFNFPGSENFPASRDHTIASISRHLLGHGYWWTRVLTSRQGLITDDENITAQNLGAESTGFETASRNQYGTYFGREKVNAFRKQHRLPTDEAIVRTFVAQSLATMVNNGVEHTLRCLARHWSNTLTQPWGNFAHQRMEQLNPFEFLRFQTPSLLVALTTLRGLSQWDSTVLAPFVKKLQELRAVDTGVEKAIALVKEMQEKIVVPACGGIASRVDALTSLLSCIERAFTLLYAEALLVGKIIVSVQGGLDIGTKLIETTDWQLPPRRKFIHIYPICVSLTLLIFCL